MDESRFDSEIEKVKSGLGGDSPWIQLKKNVDIQLRLVGEWHKTYVHFLNTLDLIPEDSDFPKVVPCTLETEGKCYFCALVENLLSSLNENDQQMGARAKVKPRYSWLAFQRDVNPEKLGIIDIGPQCFRVLGDVKREWGDFTDVENGYDIIISVGEEMGWTKYRARAATSLKTVNGIKTQQLLITPLTEEEKQMLLDAPDLAMLRTPPTEEMIIELFNSARKSVPTPKTIGISSPKISQPNVGISSPKISQPNVGISSPKISQSVHTSPQPANYTKKPKRCFGTYDPEDTENCGTCNWVDSCSKNTNQG